MRLDERLLAIHQMSRDPSPYSRLSGGWIGSMYGCQYPVLSGYYNPQPDWPLERNFISSKKCSYCGNVYQLETIKGYINCPTCAGGWDA